MSGSLVARVKIGPISAQASCKNRIASASYLSSVAARTVISSRSLCLNAKRSGSVKRVLQKSYVMEAEQTEPSRADMDEFVEVAQQLADAAGEILLQYFRKRIEITDKDDLSPVTIADQAAEQAMRSLISERFPSHAIFGEEWGLDAPEGDFDFVWVLDPIDGTKSFITGKPVFGTLICLVHKGVPIIGIIDQPVLHERWLGVKGQTSLLNGQEIATRPCSSVGNAYL